MSNLPPPPQSQSQPPDTPPWDTPSSKWFTPISTPWRTTPRSTQSTPTPTTPVALTGVIVSKSPWSRKSPATPTLDGIESEPLNDTMTLLRLRSTRTNPWIWCGAALCFIFSILLIIFGLATLILFLAVRPRTPIFDISNAKLNTIYFESPEYFNGDMLLLLNFTNPNKKLDVRFDKLSVELWFSNKMIARQGVLPFSQRNGKTRLEPIRLISNLVKLLCLHSRLSSVSIPTLPCDVSRDSHEETILDILYLTMLFISDALYNLDFDEPKPEGIPTQETIQENLTLTARN